MSPLDLSSVEGGQQRLETVAKAKESPQELKQKLAQYRQTYINEVDAQKASLTASLGSFQDVDAKAYVEKAAAALGTSVTNLAAEGEILQAKGKPAESNAGEDKEEKTASPKEVELDMSTLAGLKDTVRTEMSAQRAELAIWQKMENIVARFNKERGSEGDGKAPIVTLENLSLFMAGRQQKVKALTGLKTQYQAIGETKSGSNKQALEETPKDMADAITPFEQDIATAKEAAQIQSELADLGRSLRPIESALLAKKTLTPTEYNQYLGQLNSFGRARLEAIGALSSKGSPFNGLADAINTRIQQPFLARVSRLHGMLEARKPEGSAEKNQKLEDEGAYNEHEFQLFKQKNALLLANISKEADALAKEHQAAKKKPELWNDSAAFASWSERLAKCEKSAEEVKTATKPWIEISKLNGQAQDFLTSTLHPLEGKISTLKNVAAPERKKDVEAREKEIIGSRVQEMVTALEAQWQEKEQDSKGLLRTADTLSKLDENSEEYKEAVKNQDALFSFVLSFESKIGFFLTKPDDLAPELVTKIKDLQSKGKDWRQIIIGDRSLRATLRSAAQEKKISHTVPAVEEWKTGRGPNGPERHLVQVSPERHEEYSINDYIEFVNPLDPVNQTNNKSRGWVWKKENLPAEVKQTLEQRADIIVSEQKQKAEADAAREANKVGLENSLTERGKEALLPQAAKYFEAADLLAKGNTTAAVAAYTEYLNQSLQFTAEDRELHKSCIADARNKVEVDKQFPEYLEALQLQSRGLMEDAIKAFRKLVEKIKALPLDEQKKYQEQLNVGLEVIQQYNGDKLRLLSELSEDFIYLESIKRANMTLKGTANALDYLKLGTSPEDLEKARKMPAAAREILLPFLPAHLLTAQEKSRVANRTAGLQGPEISTMKEEIRLLGEKIAAGGKPDESILAEIKELKGKVDAGDPDADALRTRIKELEEKAARGAAVVNFEEEYQKIKQKLKPNTELEPGGVGWQDPNTGEYLASGPSSRLMAFFDQINSTDPAKREKGFLAIANEFKDQEVGMRFTQKYLRQAMLRRYRDFDAQDKGRLRETVKRRIATDKKTVAEVEANTRAAWEHWVKEENARPAKPGEEKSEILLDPPDPLVYQSFRQKTFDSILDYQYEREMRKVMTDRGEATEDSALGVYNWSMPHDADDAHWIKPWSWKNYSEDEWIDFKAQATEITIQTLATLPIGWGASTLGRGAGMGITRLLTSSIGKGLSAEAVELLASGGVQALRASPKVWKGLSAGMRAKLMAARVTGYTLGLAVEGTSLALMNNVWEGMYSGKSDLFDAIDNGKYGAAGLKLLKSIAQAGLFRMTGGAQSGIEGLAGAASGLPARLITKIAGEAVSGSGGAGVEALFMMMEGQGKQITWDWFARSMVQNAASSVGMHAGHKGLTIPKMGFMKGSREGTARRLTEAELQVTRERLSERGISSPADVRDVRIEPNGDLVLQMRTGESQTIRYSELPFERLPQEIQQHLYLKDKINRDALHATLLATGLDSPHNWAKVMDDGSVVSATGHIVPMSDIALLPLALREKYQALKTARDQAKQGPYRSPGNVEPTPPAAKPGEVPRPAPELPPRTLENGEAGRRLASLQPELEMLHRRSILAREPVKNAAALREIDSQMATKAKERNQSPEDYRTHLESQERLYQGLDTLDAGEGQLYRESKVIKKLLFDENGEPRLDPVTREQLYETINLFSNYDSKSAAFSREMLREISYDRLMAEGGSKIIKLGGDELVVYHAGPDGTVQKLFIDISNMGPTNDTATNIVGSKINLVDIYLHKISDAVLAQSRARKGQLLDPAAFNAEVSRVADSLFKLDRGADGKPLEAGEAEARFEKLKKEWGLEGSYAEYQTDMSSMRLLAEYRADTRALDASFHQRTDVDFAGHITSEIENMSGMSLSELKTMIEANPKIFRDLIDARLPKTPKLKAKTPEQILKEIAVMDPLRSSPEDLMMLYSLMARIDTSTLPSNPTMKPLVDRLTAERAAVIGDPPHPRVDTPRMMDAKVVSIALPPDVARAISALAETDPVRAHAILTAARQFAEKPLDAMKYSKEPGFAEFDISRYVEVKDGQLRVREGAEDFKKAVDTAQSDKKLANVVDSEDSLRQTRAKMENLAQLLAAGTIDRAEFNKRVTAIEKEVIRLQDLLATDPDTHAYSQSYLDLRPSRIFSFDGQEIPTQYKIWNSTVTELGHSGVINAKYGYQAMDGIMAEYFQILQKGIAAELPPELQHFKIIRSGGGKFEVVFLNSLSIEHLAKKGHTPTSLVESLARGPGQEAINKILRSDPARYAASQSDAAVRNSQFKYNKGTEMVTVGQLTSAAGLNVGNDAITRLTSENPRISARAMLGRATEKAPAPTSDPPTNKPRLESPETSGGDAARQTRRRLLNPDEISRRNDPEGRSALARAVIDVRAQKRALQKLIRAKEAQVKTNAQERSRLVELIARNKSVLAKRMETIGARLRKLLNVKDSRVERSRAEITAREAEVARLHLEAESIRAEIDRLNEDRQKINSPEAMIRGYREQFETMPLTNQEKRELLKPEVLSTLTTEEYIALWRRLNPHYLSHVTRQGFRDHVSHHSGGYLEFHNGFGKIMEEGGTLRPAMSVREGLTGTDPAAVRRVLQEWVLKADTEAEALARLDELVEVQTAAAPRYADKTSVHFAAQEVSDFYYGGEKNNEVFFLFPTDVVASQNDFALNGYEKDLTRAPKDAKWNDVFVWPESIDNPNITINAGIVFLPENIPVDPNTGSKYYSEEKIVDGKPQRVLVEDPQLTRSFVEWTTNLNNDSPSIIAYREYLNAWEQADKNKSGEPPSPQATLDTLAQEIRKLGFSEDAASDLAEKYLYELGQKTSLFRGAQIGNSSFKFSWTASTPEALAVRALESTNANKKRAQNGVPAREYWNNYFTQNPHLKPAHIVFYDGDPTTVVAKFKRDNHIGLADVSPTEGNLLGFSDRHVENMGEDPRSNKGKNELLDTARTLIAEHYGDQAVGTEKAEPAPRISPEMLTSGFSDTPPTGLPRDSAGWITEDGRIFYNSKALNPLLAEGYTMESSPRGAVIRSPRGEKLTFGQYRNAIKNTASEGMFRPLLDRMREIKNHESMHRVSTQLKDPASLFAQREGQNPLPEGKVELTDQNGKPLPVTAKNIDEFLSRVADGTQPIDPVQRATLERAIAREVPGFTFARVRNVDTRLLASNPKESFRRLEAAAMSPSAAPMDGLISSIIGGQVPGGYVYGLDRSGAVLISDLNPSQLRPGERPRIIETMRGEDVAKIVRDYYLNRPYKGMYIVAVTNDGKVVLSHVNPSQPGARALLANDPRRVEIPLQQLEADFSNQPEQMGKLPTPQIGQIVPIINSSGDSIYRNLTFTGYDPQTNEILIQGMVGNQRATKRFADMNELMRAMEFTAQIERLPLDISLINADGEMESGWRFRSADQVNGRVYVVHDDGREHILRDFDSLQHEINMAEAQKLQNRQDTPELLRQLPQKFDILDANGLREGLKIGDIDYDHATGRLMTADGRVRMERMPLRDLLADIAHAEQWKQQSLQIQAPATGYYEQLATGRSWARQERQLPPSEVPRPRQVNMIGDLHGEYQAFHDNAVASGLISRTGEYTGGSQVFVFHGDILADRGSGSLPILEKLRILKEQAKLAGGDIIILAGNHEDMSIAFLSGDKVAGTDNGGFEFCLPSGQGLGVIEFIQKFSSRPGHEKVRSLFEIPALYKTDADSLKAMQQDVLTNMRKSPEGRQILEQMCSFRLVEQINDTLFIHTELTPQIISMLDSGQSVSQAIDNINRTYQQGLRNLLLGEGAMPADYTRVRDAFLYVDNRDYNRQYKPGDLSSLNRKGINIVVNGHSNSRPENYGNMFPTDDGVTLMGVDHSYGKGGVDPSARYYSVGKIDTQGSLHNAPK